MIKHTFGANTPSVVSAFVSWLEEVIVSEVIYDTVTSIYPTRQNAQHMKETWINIIIQNLNNFNKTSLYIKCT